MKKKKVALKVESLMRFIKNLNKCSKEGFEKYCQRKEVKYGQYNTH